MAAGQVVCPFFGVVFARLTSLIDNHRFRPSVGMVEALRTLNKSFRTIKEVLDDAEERQFNVDTVRLWLEELNDASYEADDVFDECDYYGGLQQQQKASVQHPTTGYQMPVPEYAITEQLSDKVKKLIVKFQGSVDECSGLGLQKRKGKSVVISSDRRTHWFSTEPRVHGRYEDTEKLVKSLGVYRYPKSLIHHIHEDNLPVFSIVGMGGVGKTTLAQMVYNDDRVKTHFKFRCWVCVSDDFDTERIIKDIVAFLPKSPGAIGELEKLREHFHRKSSDGTFLLVLDDVWEESRIKWNGLMGLLRGGAPGSSIILTTRLEKVARIAGTRSFHYLKGLSQRDSWSLFKQYAFGPQNEENLALKKIGMKIVNKCYGLPLIAKTIGNLLSDKTTEDEWTAVEESETWELIQSIQSSYDDILLSYHNLPLNLKQCFGYCSVFPKDYQIERLTLIQLWMANGFVQSEARMELEDVGNKIFNDLLGKSFFQVVEKDEDDNIISCKMHGLLHDLAIYIAGNESRVILDGGSARATTERTRHLFVLSGSKVLPSSVLEHIKRSAPCLRTLVERSANIMNPKSLLNSGILESNFINLRALDLSTSGIELVLPTLDGIDKLIHLRYLDLSGGGFTLLPESICLLRNLQTLKLKGCSYLESLPADMRNMRSLRCLDIQDCDQLTSMPIEMGQLTSLRTLSNFIVGMECGRTLSELQDLNLGRELEIKGLQHVKTTMEARAANLTYKKNLRSLSLEWPWLEQRREQNAKEEKKEESDSESELQQHQDVIEGLQPHTNLRVLKVMCYGGVTFSPSWLTASCVPNLVKISLSYCRRCVRLPPLGKLGSLKVLDLSFMDSLKFIVMDDNDDARTFRSLEALRLHGMPNLEGWSSSLLQSIFFSLAAIAPVFPCLKQVLVSRCPELKGEVPLSGSQVQNVRIYESSSNGMVLGSLHDLPCLLSLEIHGHAEMENLPPVALENLPALEMLTISNCDSLKTLPVQLKSLATLRELTIRDCRNLVSLAEGEGGLQNLFCLRNLSINNCDALKRLPELPKNLDYMSIRDCRQLEFSTQDFEQQLFRTLRIGRCHAMKHLPQFDKTSLVTLEISDCPQMEFSTDDFEHLDVLEEITLHRLPKLTFFPEGIKHTAATLYRLDFQPCSENGAMDLPDWISTLTSLEVLSISAPKNWKMLPQWLQDFTALRFLFIYGCDEELDRRWKNRLTNRNCFEMISDVSFVEISSNVWSNKVGP